MQEKIKLKVVLVMSFAAIIPCFMLAWPQTDARRAVTVTWDILSGETILSDRKSRIRFKYLEAHDKSTAACLLDLLFLD